MFPNAKEIRTANMPSWHHMSIYWSQTSRIVPIGDGKSVYAPLWTSVPSHPYLFPGDHHKIIMLKNSAYRRFNRRYKTIWKDIRNRRDVILQYHLQSTPLQKILNFLLLWGIDFVTGRYYLSWWYPLRRYCSSSHRMCMRIPGLPWDGMGPA